MSEEIKIVSIIGAGYLGKQIAEKTALKEYTIRLYDTNVEDLAKFSRKLKRRKKTPGEITSHETIKDAVKDADLIIEAVPEILELKREIFKIIDEAAQPNAIIATNSSSIPVSKLEDEVARKDKLLNIHFYNVITMPMADIMRGTKTSDETFEKGKNWVESIDITPLIVKKECYGFVFNRIWRAIKKESMKIWAGGYADLEEVDKAWKIFTGMGIGPFQFMDQIGLDVIYDIEMSYYKNSGLEDDKPPQALKDLVDNGNLGQKTKKGFYTY
ncbi:MAG TPA: 3-hydroxyacyl-CoA dehydrogenase family protein [Candidatus Nanopelagicaceae bacterium]|nr:3-hydroxyacyl-CoA dehydrogenase family protein [Candidatus Nanopelagicaceae bacterium]